MKNIGALEAGGYGIMLFSPAKLNGFLKSKKCRAKKYLTYFNKNKDVFFDSIKAGIMLPFYRICCFEYEIFVTINEQNITIPEGYEKVYEYKNFFVTVENNKLCFSSFDYLEYHKDKIDKEQSDYGVEIPSGPEEIMEWYNSAIGLDLESGNYQFDLYGLKRIQELERESKNYAFLFAFKNAENIINENLEKCDNDIHNFDIRKVK